MKKRRIEYSFFFKLPKFGNNSIQLKFPWLIYIITFSSTDSSLSGEAKLAQFTELYGALQYLPLIEESGVVFHIPTEGVPGGKRNDGD